MSDNKSTTYYSKERSKYKDVYPLDPCQGLDCNKVAIFKILIPTVTYGIIPILVCEKCLQIFRSESDDTTYERIR
jgi:hypothetical protein